MDEHKSRRRYFAAQFRDRTVRLVFPLDDDPLRFEEQRYSDERGTMLIKPDGIEELLMKNRFVLG